MEERTVDSSHEKLSWQVGEGHLLMVSEGRLEDMMRKKTESGKLAMKQFAYDAFDEACAPVAPWSSCRCGCDSGGGCDAAGADTGGWNRSVSSGECPCVSGVIETCGKSVDNGTLSSADCGMDANSDRGALPAAGESGSGGGDGVGTATTAPAR